MSRKHAFTLAEIMIVLTVVGILTAILLPVAINSAPDENIMKFKKANSTLGNVIRELVTSDEYYLGGDLGVRADGTLLDGSHTGDGTYFCNTMANLMNTKSVNCSTKATPSAHFSVYWETDGTLGGGKVVDYVDRACKKYAVDVKAEIITTDNVSYFQSGPTYTFGYTPESFGRRLYADKSEGFMHMYKIFCIDVDGIPDSATKDDCVNECPFGYGIRTDGKIFTGARAMEWINKKVQKGD